MVQFVNVREFKTKTEAIFRRLQHGDVVLTTHGKPRALLHKVSERDLSLTTEYTPAELDRLEEIVKEPAAVYKTASGAKRHLRRLMR